MEHSWNPKSFPPPTNDHHDATILMNGLVNPWLFNYPLIMTQHYDGTIGNCDNALVMDEMDDNIMNYNHPLTIPNANGLAMNASG